MDSFLCWLLLQLLTAVESGLHLALELASTDLRLNEMKADRFLNEKEGR